MFLRALSCPCTGQARIRIELRSDPACRPHRPGSPLAAALVPSSPSSPEATPRPGSPLAAALVPSFSSPEATPRPGSSPLNVNHTSASPRRDSTRIGLPLATASVAPVIKAGLDAGTDHDAEPQSYPVTALCAPFLAPSDSPFLAHLAPTASPSTLEPIVLSGSLVSKPAVSLRALE